MGKWRHWLAVICILTAFFWLRTSNSWLSQRMQQIAFDCIQKIDPRSYKSQPVKILDIDNASLEKLGPWPWPRALVAQIASKLNRSRVAAYAFTTVFAESDLLSPEFISRIWPDNADFQKTLKRLQDGDEVLSRTLSAGNSITGFTLSNNNNDKIPLRLTEFSHKLNTSFDSKEATELITNYYGSIKNISEIEGTDPSNTTVKGNGALNSVVDKDGITRRVAMLVKLNDVIYPSIVSEVLRVGQGQTSITITSSNNNVNNAILHTLRIGNVKIPIDEHGNLWMHFSNPRTERYIPVWKFLEDDFDMNSITGNVIFIGSTAESLQETIATPINPALHSVEIKAQALEQILDNHFIERPDLVIWYESIFTIAIGISIALIIFNTSPLKSSFITITVICLGILVSWIIFQRKGVFVEPLLPALTVSVICIYAYAVKLYKIIHAKLHMRVAFSQYISPLMMPRLITEKQTINLSGENKGISILTCGIRDFSSIEERYDASGTITFLNKFFTLITEVIFDSKGTIDKYFDEYVSALWNVPLNDENHARNSCVAALNMLKCVKALNKKYALSDHAYRPIEIGIGINTGVACVGNIGSEQRFNYSALGDEVRLASQLQTQSQAYGASIIIGENTQLNIENFAYLELDLIKVKGTQNPVRIFALLGDETVADTSIFKNLSISFQEMLYYYRLGNFSDAAKAINTIKEMNIADIPLNLGKTADLFIARITELSARPPTKWEGVFEG